LDETIWRGFSAVGVSLIIFETFGKVAHALLRLKMDTNSKNKKKDLTILICLFNSTFTR
jgi:hypothetical protein